MWLCADGIDACVGAAAVGKTLNLLVDIRLLEIECLGARGARECKSFKSGADRKLLKEARA